MHLSGLRSRVGRVSRGKAVGGRPLNAIVRQQLAPYELETSRLLLRPPAKVDAAAIFEYGSDPEVTTYMDFVRLTSQEEAAQFVERCESRWLSGEESTWAIVHKTSNCLIGAIAIRAREADADFGYILNRRFWSQGYGTEATSAVVQWMLSVPTLMRIWATCDTENVRSARVLEKVGLSREGLVPGGTVRPNLSPIPRDSYIYAKAR
jgi:RimJ/RimL family protein N-acetyltransferase